MMEMKTHVFSLRMPRQMFEWAKQMKCQSRPSVNWVILSAMAMQMGDRATMLLDEWIKTEEKEEKSDE